MGCIHLSEIEQEGANFRPFRKAGQSASSHAFDRRGLALVDDLKFAQLWHCATSLEEKLNGAALADGKFAIVCFSVNIRDCVRRSMYKIHPPETVIMLVDGKITVSYIECESERIWA